MSDDLDDLFGEALESAVPISKPFNPFSGVTSVDERILWATTGYSIVFIRSHCSYCGTTSCVPEGVYAKQVHARNKCEQLVPAPYALAALDHPRTLHFIDRDSSFCLACLTPQGIL